MILPIDITNKKAEIKLITGRDTITYQQNQLVMSQFWGFNSIHNRIVVLDIMFYWIQMCVNTLGCNVQCKCPCFIAIIG